MIFRDNKLFRHVRTSKRGSLESEGTTTVCKDITTSNNNTIISLEYKKNKTFEQKNIEESSWLDNSSAWDHFCSVLTSLYAIFIIVFAMVVELSQEFTPDEWFAETLFFSYMYGAGILFLFYCYLFKVRHPRWINYLLKKASITQKEKKDNKLKDLPSKKYTSDGAGSLYLRLGTLCFGSSGIVLFCLEMFICHSNRLCYNYRLINWLLAGFFTFIQMHFIFCNSRLVIGNSRNLTKFGTMHLLAINIWTWLRFVIAKSSALDKKSSLVELQVGNENLFNNHRNIHKILLESSESSEIYNNNLTAVAIERLAFPKFNSFPINSPSPLRVSSFSYFGDFATLLTTCIVEYSVIGAAIMITIWRSIDDKHNVIDKTKIGSEGYFTLLAPKCPPTKNTKNVRIDCSASSGGLFAGLLFLIAAFVSIGIHSFFSQHADPDGALLVFRLSDMALFCCTLIGCSIGLFRMHSLQYQPREEQQKSTNTEFLDEILLAIGLVGELIHSSTGIMCWIATQSERPPIKMELYMLFVFITRILQVVVQAVFILLARRLRALTSKTRREKPGKQFVTFLLIANVSLFFFHTLEGMKSVFGETIATRRARPYATLIVGVAPLVVFYRFHSSVCLAEIWKHCYSNKNILDQEIKNKSKPSDSNDTFQTNISSSDISINSSSSPSSTSSISPSGLSSMLYKP